MKSAIKKHRFPYLLSNIEVSLKTPEFPLFTGNYNELLDVPQAMAYFSTDEKPVLATYGIYTCVGILAYNPDTRIAFLAHSDASSFDYLSDSKESMHVKQLYEGLVNRGSEHSLELKIITGGWPDNESITRIYGSLERLRAKPEIRTMEIERISGKSNICIDSRTGQILSYNPKFNLNLQVKRLWREYIL